MPHIEIFLVPVGRARALILEEFKFSKSSRSVKTVSLASEGQNCVSAHETQRGQVEEVADVDEDAFELEGSVLIGGLVVGGGAGGKSGMFSTAVAAARIVSRS